MIMQLTKGKIKVTPMRVPEDLKRIYIQYAYEFGTNHLKPVLTINKQKYEGDRMYIDTGEGFISTSVDMKVELLDSAGSVLKTYKGSYVYSKYCTIGIKPIRPDIMDYVQELEARVRQLEEEGEVI